jgi:hypothetical protein
MPLSTHRNVQITLVAGFAAHHCMEAQGGALCPSIPDASMPRSSTYKVHVKSGW